MNRRASQAFTIVELLVVVGIIALMAAIVLPVFWAVEERGRASNCMTNLKNIGQALKMYQLDFQGFPPDETENSLGLYTLYAFYQDGYLDTDGNQSYRDYLTRRKYLHCPDNPVGREDAVLNDPPLLGGYNAYDEYYRRTRSGASSLRQLTLSHPPGDTVVTWCVFHRRSGGRPGVIKAGDKDLVLWLDGTVAWMPAKADHGLDEVPGPPE